MSTDTLFELGVNLSKGLRDDDKDIARVLVHTKDPLTSYKAAEEMIESGKLSYQENQVWQWINSYLYANQKDDFTAKELVWWRYSNKYHVIERRLSGLHRKDKIERTGEKRDGCCVWKLVYRS